MPVRLPAALTAPMMSAAVTFGRVNIMIPGFHRGPQRAFPEGCGLFRFAHPARNPDHRYRTERHPPTSGTQLRPQPDEPARLPGRFVKDHLFVCHRGVTLPLGQGH